ncbi:MAG: hypothetical protein ACI8YQ_002143 [Polaribacter sp.]|jgi:hypothetical protein
MTTHKFFSVLALEFMVALVGQALALAQIAIIGNIFKPEKNLKNNWKPFTLD